MYDRDKIKFITHLPSSDSAISFYIQVVLLIVECKMPKNSIFGSAFFFHSYHFALIVSEKTKRREIKGVVIQQILHLTVSSLFLMR